MGRKTDSFGVYADTNDEIPNLNWVLPYSSSHDYDLSKENGYFKSSPSSEPILIYDRRIDELRKDVNELKNRMSELAEMLTQDSEVIELRDIAFEQAKKEITEYFKAHHGENIYSHDIMLALKIDMDLIEDVIEKLSQEGQIKEVS